MVRVNEALEEDWKKLYGIGPAYARRIVKFRKALGGFYSIDQIGEVYGLPDSTFQSIKPFLELEDIIVKTININTADAETIKNHPYLSWKQANAIVNYRKQHGLFGNVETIREIGAIDELTYNRILHYLTVEAIGEE